MNPLRKAWRRVFSSDGRSGVDMLQADMNKNPFYPFQLGLTYEDRSRGKFEVAWWWRWRISRADRCGAAKCSR